MCLQRSSLSRGSGAALKGKASQACVRACSRTHFQHCPLKQNLEPDYLGSSRSLSLTSCVTLDK